VMSGRDDLKSDLSFSLRDAQSKGKQPSSQAINSSKSINPDG
jgi:hypothetical protein